jgi:hypothetical protein
MKATSDADFTFRRPDEVDCKQSGELSIERERSLELSARLVVGH